MNRFRNSAGSVSMSPQKQRRGMTLVEVLLAVTLTSVVLSMAAMLWHRAGQMQRTMNEHRHLLDTLNRLAQQFRDDVHSATSVQLTSVAATPSANNSTGTEPKAAPPVEMFIVQWPRDKQIEYRYDQTTVSRTVNVDGAVQASETYVFPPESMVHWQTAPEPNTREASLLVSYPLETTAREFTDQRQLRIDAVVGLSAAEISLKGGAK